jgi:hypothetical protein
MMSSENRFTLFGIMLWGALLVSKLHDKGKTYRVNFSKSKQYQSIKGER